METLSNVWLVVRTLGEIAWELLSDLTDGNPALALVAVGLAAFWFYMAGVIIKSLGA